MWALRLFWIAILCTILILFSYAAFAHGDDYIMPHDAAPVASQVIERRNDYGVASAIALSQIHPQWSTHRLQGGVGMGVFNNSAALAIGASRAYCDKLYSGALSFENGRVSGGGLGVNFTW